MTPYEKIKALADDVENACCSNHLANQSFLPHDKLKDFVTEPIIRSVCDVKKVDDVETLVAFVLDRAKRLFLILILMESCKLEKILESFKAEELQDCSLPIRFSQECPSTGYSLQGHPDQPSFPLFREWGRNEKILFDAFQWRFTAPLFGTKTKFRFQLDTQQVLPFLEVSPRPISSGFFGEVSRTVIHSSHIDSIMELPVFQWISKRPESNSEPIRIPGIAVAIKKAKDNNELAKYFDKEAENLDRLREYRSPHLIKPIAAYQIGHDRCLMIPWAEGGNLGNYWERHEADARDRTSVQWILKQLIGISSGLKELHDSNCGHGDLKPENILWFEPKINKGVLQIADLGLASFHDKEANTMVRQGIMTGTPSGTSRYEPPEMDESRGTADPRSRQYDIWSMGCIILELLLWLTYGNDALPQFRIETPYFWEKQFKDEGKMYDVHNYVTSVIKVLGTQLQDDSAYKDLLYLVQTKLLVVPISEEYKSVSGCREIASKVHLQISTIHKKSEGNESYLIPLRLKYPASEIKSNRPRIFKVHQRHGSLIAPELHNVRSATLSPVPVDDSLREEANGFHLKVPVPTEVMNIDSLSTQTSKISDHHEVRELDQLQDITIED